MNTLGRSGCSQLPNCYQLLTYLVCLPNIVFTYLHSLILQESTIHIVLFTMITTLCLIFTILTTVSVPTDRLAMRQFSRRNTGQMYHFDAEQPEQYCDICEAYVKANTKHCRKCDRCCEDFDHHCKWVNNCIGGINYQKFIVMISLASMMFTYSLIIHLRVINQYVYNYDELNQYNSEQDIHFSQNDDLDVKLVISIVWGVLDIVALLLLIQLILFHIYIQFKGMSTYDYIVRNSNKVNPATVFTKDKVKQNVSSQEILNQEVNDLTMNKIASNHIIDIHPEKQKALSQFTKQSDKHNPMPIQHSQTLRMKSHENQLQQESSDQDIQFYSERKQQVVPQQTQIVQEILIFNPIISIE